MIYDQYMIGVPSIMYTQISNVFVGCHVSQVGLYGYIRDGVRWFSSEGLAGLAQWKLTWKWKDRFPKTEIIGNWELEMDMERTVGNGNGHGNGRGTGKND